MAQLTINQCQNCGKILAPGVTRCGKCHTEHSIAPAVVNPLRFTAAEAAEYRAQFQEQVEACPKDSNALFAMGLTYLGLKNYELADENFVKAVHLTPSNPDVYYYTALSMFHHRSVMNLSRAEMYRIDEWLDTAVQMQPKRKYLILQMILRQGMSSMGINVDVDKKAPAELMVQARTTAREEDELFEIEQHVLLTDEKTRLLLNALDKVPDSDHDGSPTLEHILEQYDNFCDLPKDNDLDVDFDKIDQLCSPEARDRFFDTLYRPEPPKKESVPTYIGPLFSASLRAVGAFFLFVVMFLVTGISGWIDRKELYVSTVEERMADVNTKALKSKDLKEMKTRVQNAFERDTTRKAEFLAGYDDYPSLFQYQDIDPDDELTYSRTRTSDFSEFYNSLIKMHTAYVKS